jgi:hypothetical protein
VIIIEQEKLVLEASASSQGVAEYKGQVYSRDEAARLIRSRHFEVAMLGEVLVVTWKGNSGGGAQGLHLTWSKEAHVRIMVSIFQCPLYSIFNRALIALPVPVPL